MHGVTLLPVALAMTLAVSPVQAAEAEAPAAGPPLTPSQQQAGQLIFGMVEQAAGLDAFSVNLNAGFDVLQADGQMIQFLEQRSVTVQRPNAMRSEERFSGGVGNLVIFDGDQVTVFDAASGVYAQTDTPDTLDDAVIYFQRDLNMRLPLGGLFTTRLLRDMLHRIQTIDYVETVEVGGVMTHHLAARADTVDFQVWLAADGPLLPRRVVLTYPEEGRPQFWAEFSEWNLDPDTASGQFTFDPPAGAVRAPFAVQMTRLDPAGQAR